MDNEGKLQLNAHELFDNLLMLNIHALFQLFYSANSYIDGICIWKKLEID